MRRHLQNTLALYSLAGLAALGVAMISRSLGPEAFVVSSVVFAALLVAAQPTVVFYLTLKYGLGVEARRKLLHTMWWMTVAGFVACVESVWGVLALGALAFAALIAVRKWSTFASMYEGGGRGGSLGEFFGPLGIGLAAVLAQGQAALLVPALLVVAFADSAAALVGRRYGKRVFAVPGGRKSLEGAAAFWATATAVLLATVPAARGSADTVLAAAGVAALLALGEFASGRGSDNLVVPASAVVLLQRVPFS